MSSHDEAPAGTGASSENFRQDSVDHLSDAHQTWAEWQVNEARRPRVSRKVTLTPASEIMNRPDPNFLIDGVLEEGGFGMIYSAPGLGKTFVVLSWLMAIARGEPWLGREVLQGPVVYVSAEGVGGLGKRLRAMCHDLKIKEPPSNFYVIDSPVDLMDPYSMADAIEAAHALKVRPRLIVFDTFARSLVGGDENSDLPPAGRTLGYAACCWVRW